MITQSYFLTYSKKLIKNNPHSGIASTPFERRGLGGVFDCVPFPYIGCHCDIHIWWTNDNISPIQVLTNTPPHTHLPPQIYTPPPHNHTKSHPPHPTPTVGCHGDIRIWWTNTHYPTPSNHSPTPHLVHTYHNTFTHHLHTPTPPYTYPTPPLLTLRDVHSSNCVPLGAFRKDPIGLSESPLVLRAWSIKPLKPTSPVLDIVTVMRTKCIIYVSETYFLTILPVKKPSLK